MSYYLEYHPFGPIDTNIVILACPETKECALFDAPLDSAVAIKERIAELGYSVKKLLLTHSHWDHIGSAAELSKIFSLPVTVHSADQGNVLKPGSDQVRGIKIDPVDNIELIEEGDEIQVGNLSLRVVHTPGHTPGGVCYYLEKEGVMISGDTLFCGSMGRVDLPTSTPNEMWKSLKKLAKFPDETKVYPGHGPETTIGDEPWLESAQELFNR